MAVDWSRPEGVIRVLLGGDVMTGRAIDQLFPTHARDDFGKPDHVPAARYLSWSVALHGAEMLPMRHDYIWGAALGMLDAVQPDFRLANLETAITTSDAWEDKPFTYRMHPANVGCLAAFGFDCLSLANNHVLDFGVDGLAETVATLRGAGIGHCGAGADDAEAARPHIHRLPGGKRILVFGWGFRDSGIPPQWRAGPDRPGVQLVEMVDDAARARMRETIATWRRDGDLVIASLHWGANWIGRVPASQRALARFLIDDAGVDLVHGHSAHHVLPAEVHSGKLILHGCGDLIDDAEGRPDSRKRKGHLGALYLADLDAATHRLRSFRFQPVERRRFRLELPSPDDMAWVRRQVIGTQG